MKFSDIITLAKQGYTKDDIKELLALSDGEEKKEQTEPEKETKAQDPDGGRVESADPKNAVEPQSGADGSGDDSEKDNKIKALEAEISKLKAEKTGEGRKEPEKKSIDATLADMARRFM